MVPKATPVMGLSPGRLLLVACCSDCTQLGGSSFANDRMEISGLVSLASSTLNLPKLKPATVCGVSLFHTVTFWPPSLDSLTRAPVAAIFMPLGIWKVMSYEAYSPNEEPAPLGYQSSRAIGK